MFKKESEFVFSPSVQSDLFNYLRKEQQEAIKPILRILKPWAQYELCIALIDYLETGRPNKLYASALAGIFNHIITDSNINLNPLHV